MLLKNSDIEKKNPSFSLMWMCHDEHKVTQGKPQALDFSESYTEVYTGETPSWFLKVAEGETPEHHA